MFSKNDSTSFRCCPEWTGWRLSVKRPPNAVLVVDEAGRIQRANRNVPNVLGYEPGEIEGMVVEELLELAKAGTYLLVTMNL